MSLKVDVNTIEKAMLSLLQELRHQKGDVIEIEPVDYYWAIDQEELYNPYSNPALLTLGQLTDDLDELQKLASQEAKPVSLDLVKLSAVLTAIGHKTSW